MIANYALIGMALGVIGLQLYATLSKGTIIYFGKRIELRDNKKTFVRAVLVQYGAELLAVTMAFYVIFIYRP